MLLISFSIWYSGEYSQLDNEVVKTTNVDTTKRIDGEVRKSRSAEKVLSINNGLSVIFNIAKKDKLFRFLHTQKRICLYQNRNNVTGCGDLLIF